MNAEKAILALAALAQKTRLDVFRLLVKHEPEGLPAGEIARQLGVPHNTLSARLAGLTRTGLTHAERHSRSIVYRADLSLLRRLAAFLVEDCCDGAVEACEPSKPRARRGAARMWCDPDGCDHLP
jgi:ArsR family transcriptional regulator, arsenate/arsenite/antimonite-responsive transcriptional repressor